jgi:hypothetical protein
MSETEEPRDPLIESVVRELRKPPALSPDLDARVWREIRTPRRSPARVWGWIGIAAAAAFAGFYLLPFGSGDQGGSRVGPFPVEFALDVPARSVALVGDFNDWTPGATPLKEAEPGHWATVLPLEPGRYQFTFIVDGERWVADPARPRAPDDFGEPTSVITVVASSRL